MFEYAIYIYIYIHRIHMRDYNWQAQLILVHYLKHEVKNLKLVCVMQIRIQSEWKSRIEKLVPRHQR